MPKMIDLTGRVFGKWTVIAAGEKNKAGKMFWHCRCKCGIEKRVNGRHLRDGTSTQCRGCAHRTHGATKGKSPTGEYIVWSEMIYRCHNPRHKAYPNYGGRGITVCDRWRGSFEAFLSDMGPRPQGMTLDREDNSKGYFAENCRWATYTQQNRNRRNNHIITAHGQTLCLAEWAEQLGVSRTLIRDRLRRGWSPERALSVCDAF